MSAEPVEKIDELSNPTELKAAEKDRRYVGTKETVSYIL